MRQSPPPMTPVPRASPRHLRLVQISTILILVVSFAATFMILFDDQRRAQVEVLISSPVGLVVLFFLSALSNATLILPVPGLALTALAATVANPLAVGVVAGSGQALGEMTGYLAGYSGQELIDNSPRYARLVGWMRRYGALTIFCLALVPNPIFDVAGIIAGALRMPWWLYLISASAGKILKNVALAYGASLGIDWLLTFYGH